MYQLQADPNVSRPSVPSEPPAFSPPKYAIWVNSLWFLSLVISLSCAMLATSLQQWARRYLRVAQPPRSSPHKRARMRAFFANGVDKCHVPWVVEVLPALVHLSLFVFFAGLVVYLFNIHHTVFSAVICWVALLSTIYGCITLMPIFRQDSPYYSPLSSTVWFFYASTLYVVHLFPFTTSVRFSSLEAYRRSRELVRWILGGVERAAEEASLKRSSEIDSHIVDWTVDALSEDDALEKFFEAMPGFNNSSVVENPRQHFPREVLYKIENTLRGFLNRTLLSDFIHESVKIRRLAVFLDVAGELITSDRFWLMFDPTIHMNWDGSLHPVDVGNFLRSWYRTSNGRYIQGTIALIIWSVRERNDRWIALAMDYLGVTEGVVRDYLAHGDSVLLANLIHYTRHAMRHDRLSSYVLRSLSVFDIHDTLPSLQHDFCSLWNELVQQARDSEERSLPVSALRELRLLYLALHHQCTDATACSASTGYHDGILLQPESYPACDIPSHRSDRSGLTPHPDELSAAANAHSLGAASIPVPHQD